MTSTSDKGAEAGLLAAQPIHPVFWEAMARQQVSVHSKMLADALRDMKKACEDADADEELPEHVDGSLIDAANRALELYDAVIATPPEPAHGVRRWNDEKCDYEYVWTEPARKAGAGSVVDQIRALAMTASGFGQPIYSQDIFDILDGHAAPTVSPSGGQEGALQAQAPSAPASPAEQGER